MQFKNSEIFYTLFALLIPILIHLFQLQRFVKVPFTNVKFLKEIELQTRKSSRLKKFLILLSRLGVLAALIFAFSQPYFSKSDTSKDWKSVIYIDNSLSMQAKNEQGELLKRTVQNILENLPNNGSYSLLTNDNFLNDLDTEALKDALMNLDYSSQKVDYKSLVLKIKRYFSQNHDSNHKLLWFSDFQKNELTEAIPQFADLQTDLVVLKPNILKNASIDSVCVSDNNVNYKQLTVKIKNQGEKADNITLSVFQNQILLAKKNVNLPENQIVETPLKVSGALTQVKLELDYEDTFSADNTYNISFVQNNKISVLVITDTNSFLEKIYTEDEFKLTQLTVKQVSFNVIDENQLIVLNEVKSISPDLQSKLSEFVQKGGNLTIIPNAENSIEQLNEFFTRLQLGQLSKKLNDTLLVSKIHFSHPLLSNVFEKEVSNFQYPSINTFFDGNLNLSQPVLSLVNQKPFVSQINSGKGKIYWVASPLDKNSSNFINSPLVVPVFYNMAKMSVVQNQLSYRIGQSNTIIVPVKLEKDEVLTLSNEKENLIPTQQISAEYVTLTTGEIPQKSGFYKVKYQEKDIHYLAFNNPKEESSLAYWDTDQIIENQKNIKVFENVKEVFSDLIEVQSVHSFFKWFVALALLFVLIEIALLKYF